MARSDDQNLSPRQQRLLALLLEGLDDPASWRGIGLPEDEVQRELDEIRALLDVPEGADLAEHLPIEPPARRAAPEGSDNQPEGSERRLRLLLRLTISQLITAADDADTRSAMLLQTVDAIGSQDEASAKQEAEDLTRLASEIRELISRTLTHIRERG